MLVLPAEVTHDQAVSDQVRRTIAIRDGRTSSEVLRRTVLSDTRRRFLWPGLPVICVRLRFR